MAQKYQSSAQMAETHHTFQYHDHHDPLTVDHSFLMIAKVIGSNVAEMRIGDDLSISDDIDCVRRNNPFNRNWLSTHVASLLPIPLFPWSESEMSSDSDGEKEKEIDTNGSTKIKHSISPDSSYSMTLMYSMTYYLFIS